MNSLLTLFILPHLAWITAEQRYEDQNPPPPPTVGEKSEQRTPLHAPGAREDTQTATTQAAVQWLGLLDGEEWGASWLGGSSMLRDVVTQNQWIYAIRNMRSKYGNASGRKFDSLQKVKRLKYGTEGDFVILKFKTTFSNSSNMLEIITLMTEGRQGGYKVTSYEIRRQQ